MSNRNLVLQLNYIIVAPILIVFFESLRVSESLSPRQSQLLVALDKLTFIPTPVNVHYIILFSFGILVILYSHI